MADYEVDAFRWSGKGYNAKYDTSQRVTLRDDDDTYEGGADANESVSIDGGEFVDTSGSAYVIDVSFVSSDGESHVESFDFFNAGGEWFFIPGPESEFSEGATLGNYQGHTTGWDYSDNTCFCRGTFITTRLGARLVENLRPGDEILTTQDEFATLRACLSRKIRRRELARNHNLYPVRISRGSLGFGLPSRDLLVSRQHRMLVSSPIAARMFKTPEVLIAAIKLVNVPGIYVDEAVNEVEYFHLVFDNHEIVFAENAPSESFLVTPYSLSTLDDQTRNELLTIFSEFDFDVAPTIPARPIPDNRLQKKMIARHLKNNKPLLNLV